MTGTAKTQLEKCFQFLANDHRIIKLGGEQNKFFERALSHIRNVGQGNWLSYIPQLCIPFSSKTIVKKHNPELLLGFEANGNGERVLKQSISLCISFCSEDGAYKQNINAANTVSCCFEKCKRSGSRRIVRKFHFDYQPHDNIKPDFHIQYGGKFKEESRLGVCHYCLEHFIDEPRLFYPPMDLVLVFDLMLHTFETKLDKIKGEGDWKGIVRKSQQYLWSKYWGELDSISKSTTGDTVHESLYL